MATLMLMAMGWAGAVFSETARPAAGEQTVTAAVPRHFPPHYQLSKDDEPAGFAIDILEAVAQRAGFRVEYLVLDDWRGVLAAIHTGRAQLIPNIGISETRGEFMAFSLPVETTQLVLFARRDDDRVSGLALSRDQRLGVVETNIGRQATANSAAAQVVFPSFADAIFALLSGQVDAVAYPEAAGWRFAGDGGVAARLKVIAPPIREIKRAIAVAPDNRPLLAHIDKALTGLIGTDEYRTIYRRWYGSPPPYWDAGRVVWLMLALTLVFGAGLFVFRYRLLQKVNRRLLGTVAERDRALNELAATHSSLNLALEGSEAGIWDMHFATEDGANKVVEFYLSPRMKAFLGFSDEEMPNSIIAWRRRIPLEDRHKIDQSLAACREDNAHRYEVEYRARHKNGGIRWLHSKGIMECDAQGWPLRCIGFDWDITARKSHEDQIQENKRALETLISNIPGIAYRCQFNRNWTMEFISDYCQTLTGYRADEFVLDRRVSYGNLIHPDDREHVWQTIQEAVIKGQPFNLEYRIIAKDGQLRWVQEQGTGVYDTDQPIALEGVIMDISEAKARAAWNDWERQCDEEMIRLGTRLVQPIEMNELAAMVLASAKKLTGSRHGFVGYIHPVSRALICPALDNGAAARADGKPFVFSPASGMCGWVIRENKPLLSNAVQQDPRARGIPDDHFAVTRFLSAPAHRNDQAVGQIAVANADHDYNDYHLRFIQRLADFYAIALYQLQQQTEHEQTHRTLETLSACNTTLIRAESESELLDSLCQTMVKQEDLALVWIGYHSGAGMPVQVQVTAGPEQDFVAAVIQPCHQDNPAACPAGESIASDAPLVCNDLAAVDCAIPWRHEAVQRGLLSNLAIPIRSNHEVLGSLNIFARKRGFFTVEKIRLFEELAADIGYGIKSLRTERQKESYWQAQEQAKAGLQQALVETIQSIALAVEKRDPYTAGHQRRVAELAEAIGRLMGLDEQRLEGLHLGALIHDVGKLYIPAEILNRPGRLSEHEFGMIKSHPEVGYDIIKGIDFPWPVAEMVLQHHERMDGKGYPYGLKGEQIILEARILAVADVVEAITSHRPYRAALGITEGLKEIEHNRGASYDAGVVDACIELVRRRGFHWSGQAERPQMKKQI